MKRSGLIELCRIMIVSLGVALLPFVGGGNAIAADCSAVVFEGEQFGRTLSGEIERKKLDTPIGAIDELMLRSYDDSLKLVEIYGCRHLGTASPTVGAEAVDAVCRALQKRYGLKFCRREGKFREGTRFVASTDGLHVLVRCHSNFFQQEQVVEMTVVPDGVVRKPPDNADLEIDEVMGVKLGTSVSSDHEVTRPLLNFERVVRQSRDGRITDGAYAVRDVSALDFTAAIAEFDNTRAEIERMYAIKMRKTSDYDLVKRCDFDGNSVCVSLKFEYLNKKEIRYSVCATKSYLWRLRATNAVGEHVPVELLVIVGAILAIAILFLVNRIRRRREAAENRCEDNPVKTIGMCEICGQYTEVSRRTMAMFKGDGKYKPFEWNGFEYVSCEECDEKIVSARRNRYAAIVLGCIAVLGPISTVSFFDLQIRELVGNRFAAIVEFSFGIVPVVVMMYLTKVKSLHFKNVASFNALRKQRFKLCNIGLTDAIAILTMSFAVCVLVCAVSVAIVNNLLGAMTGNQVMISQSDVYQFGKSSFFLLVLLCTLLVGQMYYERKEGRKERK